MRFNLNLIDSTFQYKYIYTYMYGVCFGKCIDWQSNCIEWIASHRHNLCVCHSIIACVRSLARFTVTIPFFLFGNLFKVTHSLPIKYVCFIIYSVSLSRWKVPTNVYLLTLWCVFFPATHPSLIPFAFALLKIALVYECLRLWKKNQFFSHWILYHWLFGCFLSIQPLNRTVQPCTYFRVYIKGFNRSKLGVCSLFIHSKNKPKIFLYVNYFKWVFKYTNWIQYN